MQNTWSKVASGRYKDPLEWDT